MNDSVLNQNSQVLDKTPSFDFQKGDIVEFCDEHYFVIENNGSQGVVNPFGETFYVRFFQWQLGEDITKFVRKPTAHELEKLGLNPEIN